MSSVNLQWVTPDAEFQIAFIARGSNPPNQNNSEFRKLFEYCLLRPDKHWSPFQMASLCVQVETSLAVAAQVKRHWSIAVCEPMDIQETSMRYMDPLEHGWDVQPIKLRKKAKSNRQSSEEEFEGPEGEFLKETVEDFISNMKDTANLLKEFGVANECIRMIYPQSMTTRFFMSGSCRSWMHYFEQRLSPHAQLEHNIVALQLHDIFIEYFPTVASIMLDERYQK